MNKYILYTALSFFLLTSCLSTKQLTKDTSILENDISIFNGMYDSRPAYFVKNEYGEPLHDIIFKSFGEHYYGQFRDYNGRVKIEAVSRDKLLIEHIIGDSIITSKILKGSIKNNHFIVGRKWRVFGIPVFFGVYQESKLALGLSSKNYLKVIRGRYNVGGIVPLMAADNEEYHRFSYINLKNEKNIYEQTQEIIKELVYTYPGKPIFFKTEFNSIDSYVWLYAKGEMLLYRINQDETKRFVLQREESESLPFKFETPEFFMVSDATEGTILGVAQFLNERIEYKTTTINMESFLEKYQYDEYLDSFMQKELFFIRDYFKINTWRY